ncbi:redoxin domain-containing protein [Gemmatimonas sp.]|uniref:redoxin domain-containing protein n=1 Tax=Gemmatimonas sp. TaxID=1962908 RepID=UPI00333F46B8
MATHTPHTAPRLAPIDVSAAITCPALEVSEWVGASTPPTLDGLRGRVVVLEAFQMLCPGCVSHGLPLAARVAEAFDPNTLQVIGLHTVFEHHDVQGTRAALEAFMHEYRLPFPVAIDAPSDGAVPRTMTRLGLRGTPSLLVLDQAGRIRAHLFGRVDELLLGALLGTLITEYGSQQERYMPSLNGTPPANGCDDTGCPLPGSAPP